MERVTVTNCDGTPAVCAIEFAMPCFAFGSLMKAEAFATVSVIEPVTRATGFAVETSVTTPVVTPNGRTSPAVVTGETISRTSETPLGICQDTSAE